MEAFQLLMCEQSWESESCHAPFLPNCTHSVRAAHFYTFYDCVTAILGLCVLAAEGTLAIVTVILIASICLSGTLFQLIFLVEREERWRSEYGVSGLAACAWSCAAVPITASLF